MQMMLAFWEGNTITSISFKISVDPYRMRKLKAVKITAFF
jgi:hypothetical protein